MNGCYTKNPEGNALVAEHMRIIGQFVTARLGEALSALVLTGSFGRGEGSIFQHADGRIEPVNDYDFLLVLQKGASAPPRSESAAWEKECSMLTGMRWIDFAVTSEDRLSRLPLTQANYDLKRGGQVVAGRGDILNNIPEYRAENIPRREAQVLLTTRFWCFIGTRPQTILNETASIKSEELRFVLQQLSKALIASGDSLLMLAGQYCVQYTEKALRMADLPGIHESERSLIAWGYSYKLGETRNLPEGYGLSELFLAALDIHLTTWESTQQKIPFFKGLFFTRLFGGAKQLIRRGSFSGFRGVLLDRIQLRFLYRMRNSSHKQCVRWVDSALLWAHCREWICATSAYAAKVAELRLK